MCYQLIKDQHVLTPSVTSSPRVSCNPLLNEDECIKAELFRLIPSVSLESEIKHVEWLTVQSSTIRKGTFIMLEYSDETPVFGLVGDILCFETTVLLRGQKYIGAFFHSHYNACVIRRVSCCKLVVSARLSPGIC